MALSSFDDIRLPMDIERGARFIRQTRTLTTRLANGFAVRNQQWQERLSQWDIKYALQEMTGATLSLGITAVDKFHEARHGSSRTFRFRDWTDYKLQDEVIAQADSLKSIFQITRTTTDFGNFTAVKNITKPSEDPADPTMVVEISAAPAPPHTIDFSTGLISFTQGANVPLTDASMVVIDPTHKNITFDVGDDISALDVGDLVIISGFVNVLNLVPQSESWEIITKVAGQLDFLLRGDRDTSLGVAEGPVASGVTLAQSAAPDGTGDITVTGFFDKHASFLEDDLVITLEWVQSGEIDNILLQEER